MAFCPPLTGRSEKVQSSARMIRMFGFAIALICRSREENRIKTGFIVERKCREDWKWDQLF